MVGFVARAGGDDRVKVFLGGLAKIFRVAIVVQVEAVVGSRGRGEPHANGKLEDHKLSF